MDLDDFNKKASEKEITEFYKAVSHVAGLLGASNKGYRVLSNIGLTVVKKFLTCTSTYLLVKKLERWLFNMKKVKRYFLDYQISKKIKL